MRRLSDTLRALRTERQLTQEEAAKALGISRSAVGMYEQGQREPGIETLEMIADYYNVDMDYLLGRTERTTRIIGGPDITYRMADSISPDICKGDIVVIDRTDRTLTDGGIYLIEHQDKTVCRIRAYHDTLMLMTDNIVELARPDDVRILGKAVEIRRRLTDQGQQKAH